MTQGFIVDTHCYPTPVACATWGLCVVNWWPLDRCHALSDDACLGDWSSTSCPPPVYFLLPSPYSGELLFLFSVNLTLMFPDFFSVLWFRIELCSGCLVVV